jgi:sarcosine oxidase/L-pipecolate oxidase
MSRPQDRSVLIIGGGAFGTSTSYHLSNRGYTKVTVLDRFSPPSQDAAATDLNKTIRLDYPDREYAELALEAMTAWKASDTPLSGLFRQTGWIMASSEMAKEFITSTRAMSERTENPNTKYLSVDDIKKAWPEFKGDFKGWTSLWSPEAGRVR